MSNYYDDFYYEPSEFEEQVEEFKESLMGSVKEDFLNKMKELEKENKELQEVKKNLDKIERECEQKKTEYDRAIQNAEKTFRKAKLEELFEVYKKVLYKPREVFLYTKKCNKCDESRNVKIVLPSGKEVNDQCECYKSFHGYVPKMMVLYDIYKNDDNIYFFYKYVKYYNGHLELDELYDDVLANDNIIKQGTKIENIKTDNPCKLSFYTKEECLAYCEYLNKKKRVPDNAICDLDGEVIRFRD